MNIYIKPCILFSFLLCGKQSTPIDKDSSLISPDELIKLTTFGYLAPFSSDVGQLQAQSEISSALRRFQSFAGIAVTGELNAETKEYLVKPRCGMPDITEGFKKKTRKRRFTLQGTSWKKSDLTWAIEDENNDGLSRGQVRNVMRKSFSKWSAVTNLNFFEVESAPGVIPDIRVKFVRLNHGDPYPFDGPSGTLAHAFYPHSNTGLSGDCHFDDDEVFTDEDTTDRSMRKLLWVAVHELGHSIGLEHSNVKGAIMYPWYQHFSGSDFDLTYDDISGIQNIYGSRAVPTKRTTRPATTRATVVTKPPQGCTNRVGAILLGTDNRAYVFNDDKMYVLYKSSEGMGVKEGPYLLSDKFPELKSVDAVFRRAKDGSIVFFHGDKFSVYNGFRLKNPGRKISDGFQRMDDGFRDVDASFVFDGKLYLFKGDSFWRFSEIPRSYDFTLDNDYPKKISTHWRGSPNFVDAVFRWNNKKIYFFNGDQYYRMDSERLEVHSGYPYHLKDSFLKCPAQLLPSDSRSGSDIFDGTSSACAFPSSYALILTCLMLLMGNKFLI